MSTRSTIAIVNKDFSVNSIYCHYDGYTQGVGEVLFNYYKDREKIDMLMNLGDISQLNPRILHRIESHSFDTPEENVVIAYNRDRKEPRDRTQSRRYNDLKEFFTEGDFQQYSYLYFLGEWFWINCYSDDETDYKLLTEEDIKELV